MQRLIITYIAFDKGLFQTAANGTQIEASVVNLTKEIREVLWVSLAALLALFTPLSVCKSSAMPGLKHIMYLRTFTSIFRCTIS